MIIINGLSTSAGRKIAKLAPPAANMNTNGKSLRTMFKSTCPDRINLIVLVKDPKLLASLFVPNANAGGKPLPTKRALILSHPHLQQHQ